MKGERLAIWNYACNVEFVTTRMVMERYPEISLTKASHALRALAATGCLTADEKRSRENACTWRAVKDHPPKGKGNYRHGPRKMVTKAMRAELKSWSGMLSMPELQIAQQLNARNAALQAMSVACLPVVRL